MRSFFRRLEPAGIGTTKAGAFAERSIWQYGSDEHNTEFWSQDLIAPQSPIGNNLGKDRRVFIPNEVIAKWDGGKNGWLNAHSIANYGWIFKLKVNDKGYVPISKN